MSAIPATNAARRSALPDIKIADGTLSALKWFAVILMTGDHINSFLFAGELRIAFEAARVVMPVFGFVLAFNLARPGALSSGVYQRVMRRMAIYALAATPFFWMLHGQWWPLNVLAMLGLSTTICYLIERRGKYDDLAIIVLFVAGGLLVEFYWFGLIYCVGAWLYCRRPSVGALTVWMIGAASLAIANAGSFSALAALPIIALAPLIKLRSPRSSAFFYHYYWAHLAILLALVSLGLAKERSPPPTVPAAEVVVSN